MLITRCKLLGFTLIETLIVFMMSSVILTGVLGLYTASAKYSRQTIALTNLKLELNMAADYMLPEIRRAGFWQQLPAPTGANNPFMQPGLDISLNASADCILFSYDKDGDGLVDTTGNIGENERFGFRLLNNVIQSRVSTANFTCTAASGWEDLTASTLVDVSNLNFQLITQNVSTDPNVTLMTRKVLMTLTGSSKQDSTLTATVTRTIRIRNHYYLAT